MSFMDAVTEEYPDAVIVILIEKIGDEANLLVNHKFVDTPLRDALAIANAVITDILAQED